MKLWAWSQGTGPWAAVSQGLICTSFLHCGEEQPPLPRLPPPEGCTKPTWGALVGEAAVVRTSYSFIFPPTFLIWFNTHSSMISQGVTMTVKAKKWFSPHSIETRSYLIC